MDEHVDSAVEVPVTEAETVSVEVPVTEEAAPEAPAETEEVAE